MSFRFLHLADLHLETRFGGREATRERLRQATHDAFARAVDHAIANRLDAILAAGDLFDDPILSVRTELFFAGQLKRLAEAGVWFVAACGNHDPGGAAFRTAGLGVEGERVHFFRGAEPEVLRVTNREGAPVGVVVGAGHATAQEATNLAASFPSVAGPLPVVGLLHTSVESAKSAADHDRYAPSTRADYERSPYAYWALGHIHLRQQALPGLPVHYPGNLQGRNPSETGAKGGLVVEAESGASAEPRFVRLASVRWERVTLRELPASRSFDELAAALARCVDAQPRDADEQLALRLELAGETPLAGRLRARDELETLEEELAARTGVLELQLRAERISLPIDRAQLREAPSVLAEALALIARAGSDDALLDELAPAELAAAHATDAARLDYLRGLLEGLPEELTLLGVARERA
jgi:exonuclease SbcD